MIGMTNALAGGGPGPGPTPTGNIYGVIWPGTNSSVCVRTDDSVDFVAPNPAINGGTGSSPFDNIMPWSGMVKETVSGLGTLVKIPKYWYKWTKSGSSMQLQIANYAAEGFHVSPAHANRFDGKGERDFVYIGRYHCASDYMSKTGVSPVTSITLTNCVTNCHNLNANAWCIDYAMWWTVNMLYLVEFANWDSQNVIGYGGGSGANTGSSDAMQYHTGTMKANRTTSGTGCQYRWIEDWWGNVHDWCAGIRNDADKVFVYNNPATFISPFTSGGEEIASVLSTVGWIMGWSTSEITGAEYALYPNETYDNTNRSYTGAKFLTQSGYSEWYTYYIGNSSISSYGLFDIWRANGSSSNIGCRLMYLP